MIIKLGGPRGWHVQDGQGNRYESCPHPDGSESAVFDTVTKFISARNCESVCIPDGEVRDKDGNYWDSIVGFLERWSK